MILNLCNILWVLNIYFIILFQKTNLAQIMNMKTIKNLIKLLSGLVFSFTSIIWLVGIVYFI